MVRAFALMTALVVLAVTSGCGTNSNSTSSASTGTVTINSAEQ